MRRRLSALLAVAALPMVIASLLLAVRPAAAASLTQVTNFGNNPTNTSLTSTLTTGSAIRGVGSGRCLDVTGASQANGTPVQIWDCNGQNNQQWTPTGTSELRVYDNKCLEVYQSATGIVTVQIWDCNGQNNQKWRLNSDGSITALGSNRCLEVPGNATANGTRLSTQSCNGGANQRWTRT
ncbi:RICIN domain-containing protein [Streptosporangium sp. NPDC049046]|uniref:RICIN domain-containing protein n=1 Tax=unclassified Streptosporangium TaxID=2632669 RepID=UPI00341FF9C0